MIMDMIMNLAANSPVGWSRNSVAGRPSSEAVPLVSANIIGIDGNARSDQMKALEFTKFKIPIAQSRRPLTLP